MSLAELLGQARAIKAMPGTCSAIWLFNENKRQARAWQEAVHWRYCESTEFVWSADDGAMICLHCLTPQVKSG